MTCLRILVCAVVLAACAPPPRVAPPAPPPSKRAFVVRYRAAANAFAIVDELSEWREEKPKLVEWAEMRRRNRPDTAGDPSIFVGRTTSPDELAAIFNAEDDLEVALAKAEARFGAADAKVLRATLAELKSTLDPELADSRAFVSVVPKLQARLDDPKVTAFVDELARFYGSGDVPPFAVQFVYWPDEHSSSASVSGETLLLRYNPRTELEDAGRDVDVALHEVAHFVSTKQPEAQKRALSIAFVAKCGQLPANITPSRLFEEPLAIAHQKMFLAQNDPAHFDRERPWYGDPWASVSGKMIYDAVALAHAQHRVLDERIALAAGRSCRELSALAR